VIDRGGMGVVFKARDTRLQRVVAIKVLARPLAASATARQRFFREARAAAAVRDEHVVSIHAVSDDSGPTPYLVMEFIAGVSLKKRIQERGALAVKEVLRIGMQAAEGLAAAHRQGLIHRDVKPANIVLENGVERVKIADFGLARVADDASLSQSGAIAGTPLYMSPEQARGEALDARSDLFSLGSVLYTLCTGRAAFAAGNTMAVMKRVSEEAPRPIREINPDIPEWLAAVVDRLLAKEARQRFQTAAEVADVLGQHLAQVQQSRPVPAGVAEKQGAAPPAAAQAEPGRLTARKRKRMAMAVGLVGLVGVASGVVIIALLWRPKTILPSPDSSTAPAVGGPGVLTVSKRPEDRAQFRTIGEALDAVQPGMTIRVLDDAVYDETPRIDEPAQYRGVVLEAVRNATIHMPPDRVETVIIRNVQDFTLRGFRIVGNPGDKDTVEITGNCPGVVLDRLDITANSKDDGVCVTLSDVPLQGKDDPVVIQNCILRKGVAGVHIRARDRLDRDRPLPINHVLLRENTMIGCGNGVRLGGAVHKVHVVGNRIRDNRGGAIELTHLLPGTEDILVANNTMYKCGEAVTIWDDHTKGMAFLECRNVRIQNNVVIAPGCRSPTGSARTRTGSRCWS
jgi:tRNA A-37 threonylcarbamoyl transferase component Bud32